MTGQPKTGLRMFELISEDIKYIETKFEAIPIAWTTDDGPDGKKARRLLSEHFPHIITVVCWAHQINLIVGDYLKDSGCVDVITRALELVKWFNNHGNALDVLREQQRNYCNFILILILPIITRWTAHLLSVSRLIEVQRPMQACVMFAKERLLVAAGKTEAHRAKAQEIVDTLEDPTFWSDLKEIKSHLEPLAIAANITQASHTRLDHVLLTLANLFRLYSLPTVRPSARDVLHASLEKRWKKADQDAFILAVLFNPYLRARSFNKAVLPGNVLVGIAKKMFRRLFQTDPGHGFTMAVFDYTEGCCEFSDEVMHLVDHRQSAQAESQVKSTVHFMQR